MNVKDRVSDSLIRKQRVTIKEQLDEFYKTNEENDTKIKELSDKVKAAERLMKLHNKSTQDIMLQNKLLHT